MNNCPKCNAPPIATVAKAEWECGSYIPRGMKSIQRSDTCCCSEAIARCEELESQLQLAEASCAAMRSVLERLREYPQGLLGGYPHYYHDGGGWQKSGLRKAVDAVLSNTTGTALLAELAELRAKVAGKSGNNLEILLR